ncbi:MAG TPA: hypothetical protein PKC28_09640 [Bdellovibrionales bacterium]|nr:hypothetical protein [Bdellovibrionales bacterium]
MRSNIFSGLLCTIAVAGITSCGGKAGQPLTQQHAPVIIGAFQGQVLQNFPQNNNPPANLAGTGVNTTATAGTKAQECETVTPANLTDNDGDGIALTRTSTFDCSGTTNGDYAYERKGSITVRDMNDDVEDMIGGLRVDFNLTKFNNTQISTGQTYSFSYLGFWEWKTEGTSMLSEAEFTGKNKYESNGMKNDYTYHYTWDWKLTPDDASSVASVWQKGKIEYSGTFQMEGSFIIDDSNGNSHGTGTYVFKYYSENLVYDQACTGTWYRSGSWVMEDGNGNVFKTTYDCTGSKFYVNGVESDWLGQH